MSTKTTEIEAMAKNLRDAIESLDDDGRVKIFGIVSEGICSLCGSMLYDRPSCTCGRDD